jgi:hypothetical protein
MKISAPSHAFITFVAILNGLALASAGLGQSIPAQAPPDSIQTDPGNSRYGLFNLLDHRSAYGVGVFPEPFIVDDSDLEVNEFRVDWLHTELHRQISDTVTTEIEHGFELLTVEVELPYEHDTARLTDPVTGQSVRTSQQGIGNVSLGARLPFYQYVSTNGVFDTTFGVGIEVGIPTNSQVSKNTEVVPKLLNDTAIGDFTLQTVLGYSTLFGSGDDGGVTTFEYGFVFGYNIQHRWLPIPGVKQLVPVFELQGNLQTDKADNGHNSLLGNAGFRLNLNSIGNVQPRLGMGYVFPIDHGGKQSTQWGIITSLVFEF